MEDAKRLAGYSFSEKERRASLKGESIYSKNYGEKVACNLFCMMASSISETLPRLPMNLSFETDLICSIHAWS